MAANWEVEANWAVELAAIAELSDQDAADAINAMTAVNTKVPRLAIKELMYAAGVVGTIELALLDPTTTVEHKKIIYALKAYMNDPEFTTMDLSLPFVQANLALMQSVGWITEEQVATVNALQATVKKYSETITAGMVAEARKATA